MVNNPAVASALAMLTPSLAGLTGPSFPHRSERLVRTRPTPRGARKPGSLACPSPRSEQFSEIASSAGSVMAARGDHVMTPLVPLVTSALAVPNGSVFSAGFPPTRQRAPGPHGREEATRGKQTGCSLQASHAKAISCQVNGAVFFSSDRATSAYTADAARGSQARLSSLSVPPQRAVSEIASSAGSIMAARGDHVMTPMVPIVTRALSVPMATCSLAEARQPAPLDPLARCFEQ